MADKNEFLHHFCRENKSLGLTEESDIRKIDINDSFEHKSSGYNSCGSTEEIRSVRNEEIDSKELQSVGDREECPSKASCDTSDLIYDAVSKIIRDIDNEEELKDDNTSNTMCKESNTDNENAQDEILNRAKGYSCVDEELKDDSDYGNQLVEESVTFIIDEIIDTVVPTVGPTIALNGCDDVDARLQRQNAFDEDTQSENTIRTFVPDFQESFMPTKDNNPTDSTNDEYKLEETKIDKLSCKPSQHPNLCSPISVEGGFEDQLSFDDSTEYLCDRTPRRSDRHSDSVDSLSESKSRRSGRHSDSRDSSYDRRSRRSNRSSSTDSSVSAADGSSVVGTTSGRADSKDSMCDGLSRYGSANSLVSNSSEYEVEKRKPKLVQINGGRTDFTRIETVQYKYKGRRHTQHYIKNLKDREVDGCIVLKPKDLLLKVKGTSVENVKQKTVLKIFKKIKPNRKGRICLSLTFRRWEKEAGETEEFEVDYKLQLTLEPETDEKAVLEDQHTRSAESYIPTLDVQQTSTVHQRERKQLKRHKSFKVAQRKKTKLKETPVPRGQIDSIEDKGVVTGRLRVVYSGPDEYITAGDDGKVLIQVPTSITDGDNLFNLHQMEAIDLAPETYPIAYLTRISPRGREPKTFLMSDMTNGNGLKFKASNVTVSSLQKSGDVDESIFIIREFGEQMMFESLLYRGNYISSTFGGINIPPTLEMAKKSNSEVKNDTDIDSCKFEYFKADSEYFGESEHSENFLSRLVGLFVGCVSCRSSRHQANTNSLRIRGPSSINQRNQEGR